MSAASIGYIALLRENRAFRRLWYGQVVSQLGDWFDSIALFALLYKLTGSGQAVGALLVAQFLPATIVGMWAGVIVDRLPRKLVLIATNLGCAALVLLFLLVRSPGQVWLIYAATILKMSLVAFFDPARTAAIPNVTRREELIAANAISGATWSAMLAIGAGLGGIVAGTLGTDAAFLIDAASFVLSALCIWQVPIPEPHLHERQPTSRLQEFREGFAFVFHRRDIAVYTLTKTLWSFGGGILLLLTVFGRQVFPLGVDGALSIGLLYAARGVGAGIGPLLARRWGGDGERFLRRAIGPAFLCTALGYAVVSGAPSLLVTWLGVMLAHVGGSVQWVFSTALLQMNVPNRLQGRVFAVEGALLTLATALSSYSAGLAADAGWPPRALALALAGVFVPTGLLLLALLWSAPRPARPRA
ncbi:MFS transporter [Kouleothrix sp.]|uniref:MFS transporter n=1 Tax=Kouleothrix sp. TaxID=2779161 RepID=UPI00391BBB4C